MSNSSDSVGRESTSKAQQHKKGRKSSAATFGLTAFGLYLAFIIFAVIAVNFTSPSGDPIIPIYQVPDEIGYALFFGLPILIGIAGLLVGIQKGRPGIGVLALVLTPIGFFFALAARDKTIQASPIVPQR